MGVKGFCQAHTPGRQGRERSGDRPDNTTTFLKRRAVPFAESPRVGIPQTEGANFEERQSPAVSTINPSSVSPYSPHSL